MWRKNKATLVTASESCTWSLAKQPSEPNSKAEANLSRGRGKPFADLTSAKRLSHALRTWLRLKRNKEEVEKSEKEINGRGLETLMGRFSRED